MDIQSSAFNKLFELYPMIIQGWVSPVKPADIAHGGIPKVLYDGNPQGLECLVDPWTELQMRSWTMSVDDRVDQGHNREFRRWPLFRRRAPGDLGNPHTRPGAVRPQGG